MIIGFSKIIAVIITVIIACTLYPIAGIFFVIDKVGDAIGWISKKAFNLANNAIHYLWKDLKSTKIVKNASNTDNAFTNNPNPEIYQQPDEKE